jgi:hypothetical protein
MSKLKVMIVAGVMIAVAAMSAAGDMALTQNGDLYRVAQTEQGLVITATLADGSSSEYTVPQTANTVTSAINLAVDSIDGGIFLLWQQDEAIDATVMFASYNDDAWFGPTLLAGGDGTAAARPQMLLFRAESTVEDIDENGDPIFIEVVDTYLHTTWWSFDGLVEEGVAIYLPIPLDELGSPDVAAYDPVILAELLPYGIHCDGIESGEALASPKLFLDLQSGFPHVFATDFAECLFHILELAHVVGIEPVTERRRHTIILRHGSTIAVDSDLPLATSNVVVGRDLTLVLYWDGEGTVEYKRMSSEGSSEVMSLTLGENLNHEQAVELIRGSVR